MKLLRSLLSSFGLPLAGLGLVALSIALLLARADASHWRKVAANEAAGRSADRAAMVKAGHDATFAALMNVYRAEAARRKIDERTINALAHDRDRAAAGYHRLRVQAEAYLGSPGHPDLSVQREATCRAVAGTGCEAIPALLKAAQDNTDQLLAWIAWGTAQSQVPAVIDGPELIDADNRR